MKSEKGFATIFALCLILVAALVVKGINEAEMNHAYEAADFHSKYDLQSAADSGIYEAAEKVRVAQETGTELLLPAKRRVLVSRTKKTARGENIQVQVWGERLNIQSHLKKYPTGSDKKGSPKYGFVLLSVAEMDSGHMNGKIYRRAYAYVIDGFGEGENYFIDHKLDEQDVAPEDKNVIHFMELPSGETK